MTNVCHEWGSRGRKESKGKAEKRNSQTPSADKKGEGKKRRNLRMPLPD